LQPGPSIVRVGRTLRWIACAGVVCLLGGGRMTAQEPVQTDSDPTRPILVSVRPEFYRITPDIWRSVIIGRFDMATLRERRWLGGRRGLLLRMELPLAGVDAPGASPRGLGDAYAQVLTVPRLSGRFAFAVGTGLFMPTATNTLLGGGKWTLAPAAVPVWFQRGVGMAYVKFQNLTSFAGDARRPDVNVLLITPTLIHTLGRKSWVLIDSETKTDWRQGGRTGLKSGAQIGHVLTRRFAFWVKPEFWWGANQDGRWNLKSGIIVYR
jgi:hypothetical protein